MAAMPLQMSPALLFSALLPCRLTDEISVKGLEMTEVENYPVALGNRSLIKRLWPNQAE